MRSSTTATPNVQPSDPGDAKGLQDRARYCKHLVNSNTDELIRQFEAGTSIDTLIEARTAFMDSLLIGFWRETADADTLGRAALLAVGGYGRRELHLHADIDLLILLDDEESTERENCLRNAAITRFINLLWDAGFKLGYSVRTVADTVSIASQDQCVMTNLLEARWLEGSLRLADLLSVRLGPEHLWPSRKFFEAKLDEQRLRHTKYHDTAYNLEPNIKEGPGGLRDIQMIGWIIKRHHDSDDLRKLLIDGWLTEAEFAELMGARQFLWRVRFALHALTGRCEDRLLFDHQRTLAVQFGYTGDGPNDAVEQFMQQYFRTVMGVERLNEMVLQLFHEVTVSEMREALTVPINRWFQAVNNYLEALSPTIFVDCPRALLEIFLLLQQNTVLRGIRASTIRLIRQSLHLIDERFRSDPEICQVFMNILRQPGGITHQLRRMNRYGILAAYLPAFGRVVGRMQYDLFHVYTVDEHTLFVVRNLRRFALDRYRAENPHCHEIFHLVEKPELLYIAGLMHDIAKGRGGDHSMIGEAIAQEFCARHGLDRRDTEQVQWLVRHHLLMSMTAQRKDISDPDVIHEFASTVGDPTRLNLLYLLTVADIRATNPSLWNAWKGTLLRELFTATRWAFRRGLEQPPDLDKRIADTREESRALLRRLGLDAEAIDRIWECTSDEYFLRYLPDEIAWHTIAIASCADDEPPLVLLRPLSQRGSAEIFVYARNQDHLFAHNTAVLDQLGLTIFDAKIITTANGFVLNSYHVLEQDGEPIKDHRRQIQICAKLKECLLNPQVEPLPVRRLESRQIKHFTVPTQIFFESDPQGRYTVLELIATDRPGLLSKVGLAFSRCDIRLYNARISTIGSRVEDIFYITDRNDRPLQEESQKQKLQDSLFELVGTR